MKRGLIILVIFILLLITLLVALPSYLLCSPSGLNLLTQSLIPKLGLPIKVHTIQGCIFSKLSIDGIQYIGPPTDVEVDHLELAWEPRELLNKTLHIKNFAVVGLDLKSQASPEKPKTEEKPFEFPELPLQIIVDNLALQKAQLMIDPKSLPIIIDSFSAQAHVVKDSISLKQLDLAMPGIVAHLNGEATPKGDFPFDIQGDWQVKLPKTVETKGKLSAYGNLKNFSFHTRADVNLPQTGPMKITTEGIGNQKEVTLKAFNSKMLDGEVNLSGTVSYAKQPPQVDLQGYWHDIKWVQDQQTNYFSKSGDLVIDGTTDHYRVQLQTELSGGQIPTGKWSILGEGNTKSFNLSELEALILDGRLLLSGEVDWSKEPKWKITLQGEGINPGKQWRDWPGKLNLQLTVPGQLKNGKPYVTLENTEIAGRLRNYDFRALATAKLEDKAVDIQQFELISGKSKVNVQGQVDQQLNLNWSINSDNLAEFYPQARGQLHGQGKVSGKQQAPQITAQLDARDIAIQDINIAKISSDVAVDIEKGQAFKVSLLTEQAKIAKRVIKFAKIISNGSAAQHTLSVDVDAIDQQIKLTAAGGLDKQTWKGQLTQGLLADKILGQWQLNHAAVLSLSAEQAHIEPLCWHANNSRWCLSADWQKQGQWKTTALLENFSLERLKTLLPPEMQIQGTINTHLDAEGIDNVPNRVVGNVDLGRGFLRLNREDDSPIVVKFKQAQTLINLNKQSATTEVILALDQQGASPLRAKFVLPPLQNGKVDPKTLPVQGELTGKFTDLSPIAAFAPDLEKLKGVLDINLRLGGKLSAPQLGGYLALQNASVSLPALGVKYHNINFQARGEGPKGLLIDAKLKSGDGQLTANGVVSLDPNAPWPLQVNLKGNRFEAINQTEAWALISPKLLIQAGKNGINVTGDVEIPEAKLEPVQKHSAIPVSEDIVIVPNPAQPAEPKNANPVTAQVRIVLGEKVTVKTKEFKANLQGALSVNSLPGSSPSGSGEIKVVNGLFSAYGQKLKINQGRVIFAGGGMEDPGLDIHAFREVENIKAGVKITGRASQPVLTLYSEPTMNQDEILSYVMFGKPLKSISGDQGSMLLSAASSLGGGDEDNFLTQNIAKTFGLDEVQMTQDENDPTAVGLQVGKYLTPQLYLSYGAGMMDPIGRLKMRYNLSKAWLLEAEAGARIGVDLLYSMER